MTQKHHQEEISGPLDTIEAAPLAKDLPSAKRARIQSRKARENQAQSRPFEVLSPRPAISASSDSSLLSGICVSSPKQQQPPNSQNSSKRTPTNSQNREEKEEWQKQVESARNKPEKLEILRKVIGSPQPYPQKLNIPTPPAPGRVLLRPHEYKPVNLFHRFIPKELFTEIAEHTNKYAFEKRNQDFSSQRSWQEVTTTDIEGYIGAILLIGAQLGGRDLEYYWNSNENQPDWPVAEYISRDRFEQITRYLKINRPGPIPDNQWYQKLEPLAMKFREATTAEVYELPQDLSIDEQLIGFKGRSKHTIQMNSKAAGEGYKIYSLCCSNGYMIDFKFSSAKEKVAELGQYSEFSQSEAVVLDFAYSLLQRFPRPRPYYVLHLDNFFTTRKLYQELYELGIGANGTAKAGSGIPKELTYLRDAMTKQNDHGEWFNWITGSVNYIAFCDSALKAMMTTVYNPIVDECVYFEAAKRPGASLKYTKFAESLDTTNSVSSAFSANATLPAPPAPPATLANSTNSAFSIYSANSANAALPAPPAPPENSLNSTFCTFSANSVNATLPALSAPPENSAFSAFSAPSTPSTPSAFSTAPTNSTSRKCTQKPFLRKLYPLDRYNKEMGGSDNHAKQNSFYTTGRHYHRRNWLPLFYFLIDAAVTNAYILYKLGKKGKEIKILSHAEFQEEIARDILRGPGAILRQRPPRHPRKSCNLPIKSVHKEASQGHAWGESDKYRRCQVCHPPKKRGPQKRERNPLAELPLNALNNAQSHRSSGHRTRWSCITCSIPICHNSHCWNRHMQNL